MKKRKIIFHINSLGKGGAERVLTVLAGYFAREGNDVTIVTLWRADNEYEMAEGIKRINLGDNLEKKGRISLAVRRFTDLRGVIKRERPDIVISFCMKANFRSSLAMIGMKTPLLISVRSDPQIDYAPHRRLTKWMEKKAAGCVFQTGDAQAFFGKRLQEKSRIIWNPINEKYLPENRKGNVGGGKKEEKDEKISGGERDKAIKNCIVTVGRITFEKNQMLLVKAFAKIKDKFPEMKIRIYGEGIGGEAWKELDRYIRQNAMEEKVEFMGQCSTLEKELSGAALFVLPSNYEGMSNALMEAMAMGLPVIATDCPCGGSAMLIEDGASGLLVPTGDEEKLAAAMERVLSDREFAGRLAENAEKLAEKAAPVKICEKWRDYVEELIGN
ncbi:MAG: glycosyltransferase [Clostridium sp.]|nr:glycosyltransferase [Clostridium sp.]